MRSAMTAAVLVAALGLAGCAAQTPTTVQTGAETSPSPQQTTEPPQQTETGSSVRDELVKGSVRHTLRSGGITVQVVYTVPTPVNWSADAGTPVGIEVSARDDKAPKRKVYLARSTLRVLADDGSSVVPTPDPLTDTSNISPGYVVVPPYTYNQSFAVAPLDRSARNVTLDVKLELVMLVDKKSKDYAKRSVVDGVHSVSMV